MDWLKNIGYLVVAILAVAVVTVGGAIISALIAALGSILIGVCVVVFVAFLIKEYCEGRTTRK